MSEHDPVNKPSHYQIMPGFEVYDVRMALMDKIEGASHGAVDDWSRAWEYLTRMWGKNGLEDAKKSRWYLDKLIDKLEAEPAATVPRSCPGCGAEEGSLHHPDCYLMRQGKSRLAAAAPATVDLRGSAISQATRAFFETAIAATSEPAAQIDDESDRQQAVAQNGNDGIVYDDPWYGAPEWARFKAQDASGDWFWYSHKPVDSGSGWVCDEAHEDATWDYARESEPDPNWRDTLIERPVGQDPQE